MTQIKDLATKRPTWIKIFGRWVEVRSSKEFVSWVRIRDRRLAKMDKRRRKGKPYIID